MRLGLAAVLSLVACDAVLGIEVLPRGGAVTKPIAYASKECGQCNACVAERATCARDTDCDKVQRCVAACAPDDARCRATCDGAFPLATKQAAYGALDQCLRSHCTEQCLGVRGLATIFGEDCGACLDATCAKETLACVRSGTSTQPGNCERALTCIKRDGLDPDHVESCLSDTLPESEVSVLRRCWATLDCAKCPLGRRGAFECVRNYRWQYPTGKTVAFDTQITTFDATRKPVRDVTVRACLASTCASCGEGVAHDITGADGRAHLDLPVTFAGFGGCFTLEGEGLAPMIIHPGHPIVRNSKLPMFVIPKAALATLGPFFGTTTLPDRGHLVTIAADCLNYAASGIHMDVTPIDPEVRSGYFVGSTLDPKATETGAIGIAFYLNLPATSATKVDATRSGTLVSRTLVTIAPEHITVVLSPPLTAD